MTELNMGKKPSKTLKNDLKMAQIDFQMHKKHSQRYPEKDSKRLRKVEVRSYDDTRLARSGKKPRPDESKCLPNASKYLPSASK